MKFHSRRLKYSVLLLQEKSNSQELEYLGLENIRSYTGEYVQTEKYEPENGCLLYSEKDVLFNKLRPYLAKVFLPQKKGKCTGELLVLRPNEYNRNYLFYLLLDQEFIRNVDSFTYGSKMPRANWEYIGNCILPIPPLPIQKAIAAYLDRHTARIDALIAKKERQIELLREKRQAIITRAVTKGLDPNAKMKDSGVDWIGEIPEGWEVRKLKFIVSLKSGNGIITEEIQDEGRYPVFGGNGFRGYSDSYTHEGEYVLIGRQGALCGNINYASGKFWASEHAVVATPKIKFETIWLGEVLRVMNLNQYSISAAQPGLSVDKIKEIFLPVPPLEIQENLSSYFRKIIKYTDNSVKKITDSLSLLREYRSSLITAVVSGQIDVSGEAAP